MWQSIDDQTVASRFVGSINWSDSDLQVATLYWPSFSCDGGIANYECVPSAWIGALVDTGTQIKQLDMLIWSVERFDIPLSLDHEPMIEISRTVLEANRRVSLALNPGDGKQIVGAKLAVRLRLAEEDGPRAIKAWADLAPPWPLV